jgi:hypothetical protein
MSKSSEDDDNVVRCPHCQKVLHTRWKAGLTAVERAKRLHERQLKHFAETQRRAEVSETTNTQTEEGG